MCPNCLKGLIHCLGGQGRCGRQRHGLQGRGRPHTDAVVRDRRRRAAGQRRPQLRAAPRAAPCGPLRAGGALLRHRHSPIDGLLGVQGARPGGLEDTQSDMLVQSLS